MSALPQAASQSAARTRRTPLWRRFWPSSVRTLVIGGFGLLILALAVVTIGASFQVRKHQTELNQLEHHSTQASLLQTAEAQAGIAALLLQRYVATGQNTYVQEINDHANAAQTALELALANGGPDGGLDVVVASGSTLVQGAAQTAELRRLGDAEAASAAMEQIVPIFTSYRLQLDDLAAAELAKVAQLRSDADLAGNRAFWLLVSSGSIGMLLGIAATIWIARSIFKPLASLEDTARRASEGDLTARAPTTGPREFAHLGSVLNNMMGKIEERTDELRRANQAAHREEPRPRRRAQRSGHRPADRPRQPPLVPQPPAR